MKKQMGSQGTPEQIEEAVGHMSEKEINQSADRETGYDLLGEKDKIRQEFSIFNRDKYYSGAFSAILSDRFTKALHNISGVKNFEEAKKVLIKILPETIHMPLSANERSKVTDDYSKLIYGGLTAVLIDHNLLGDNKSGVSDRLMHIGEYNGKDYSPKDSPNQEGSFESAFIHEFLGLAKDYVRQIPDLDKNDKIEIINKVGRLFDKEYLENSAWEYEAGAHGKELKMHFAKIKEELEKELE